MKEKNNTINELEEKVEELTNELEKQIKELDNMTVAK